MSDIDGKSEISSEGSLEEGKKIEEYNQMKAKLESQGYREIGLYSSVPLEFIDSKTKKLKEGYEWIPSGDNRLRYAIFFRFD